MNKIKKIAILLSLSLFFVIPAKADNSFPGFPMSFYGTVTVDGLPLPGDSKVQVFSGNNMIGEVSINDNGVYGYDDPMKIKLVVNNFTEDLIFKYLVNDSESQTGLLVQKYTEGFQSGKSVLKNLLFVTKKNTPSTVSGGGGGGGGGNSSVLYCSSVIYSSWGDCIGGKQARSVLTIFPQSCSLTSAQQIETTRDCELHNTNEEVIDISSLESTTTKMVLGIKITNVIEEEKELTTKLDNGLIKRLAGRILLQVERFGQAWYLEPVSLERYYLSDGQAAYNALRKFGLGIKNVDLNKIQVGMEPRFEMLDTDNDGLPDKLEEALGTNPLKHDTDGDGVSDGDEILKNNTNPLGPGVVHFSAPLSERLKGRIVIQVESRGEAWYINPVDGKRYYLADGEAAYQIMRYMSLGINNENIRKITVGDLEE